MEFRQLRQIIAVSETLSFHKAATRLNMAQPPLSISIRKLEQELGVKLFVRSQRGVSLTPAGVEVIADARKVLFAARQLSANVLEHAGGMAGRLRVGFVGSATYELLPTILPSFRERYPNVDVVLSEMTTVEMLRDLERRNLDVGLVRLPLLEAANTEVTVVGRDRLVVAFRHDDPLAQRRKVQLKTLADRPFIIYSRTSGLHQTVMLACQTAGFVPLIAQQATQVDTMLCLVESGLGVALVPSVATRRAPRGVRFVDLASTLPTELGLAVLREADNPLAENFCANALRRPVQ